MEDNDLTKIAALLRDLLRIVEGGQTSPDYPDNLPGLMDEVIDLAEYIKNVYNDHAEKQ